MISCFYQTLGISTYRNLCDKCNAARKAAGWDSKEWIRYVDAACDDCHWEASLVPASVP